MICSTQPLLTEYILHCYLSTTLNCIAKTALLHSAMWHSVFDTARRIRPGDERSVGRLVGCRRRHQKQFVPNVVESLSKRLPWHVVLPIIAHQSVELGQVCARMAALPTAGYVGDSVGRRRSRQRQCGIIIANDVIGKWRALPNWAVRGRAPSCLSSTKRVCVPCRTYVRGESRSWNSGVFLNVPNSNRPHNLYIAC